MLGIIGAIYYWFTGKKNEKDQKNAQHIIKEHCKEPFEGRHQDLQERSSGRQGTHQETGQESPEEKRSREERIAKAREARKRKEGSKVLPQGKGCQTKDCKGL